MKDTKYIYIFNADYIMWVQTRLKSINQALNVVVEVFRIITNRECMDLSYKHMISLGTSTGYTTKKGRSYFCL
jgi:hypothetical protein